MNDLFDQSVVLIPAYNESTSIRQVVEETLQYCRNVIVIDDGSSDNTASLIDDLPITLMKNLNNLGKGKTLLKGFHKASTLNKIQYIITIDADTQHDPKDIPRLIKAAQQYPDSIIIAARLIDRDKAPTSRRRANEIGDFFISWAAGNKIQDTQSGYRLYPINTVKKYIQKKKHAENFAFEGALLIDNAHYGYNTHAIPIHSRYPKKARASHYQPISDTIKIIRMVTWKLISRGFNLIGLWRVLFK